jgi:hypothetical protein
VKSSLTSMARALNHARPFDLGTGPVRRGGACAKTQPGHAHDGYRNAAWNAAGAPVARAFHQGAREAPRVFRVRLPKAARRESQHADQDHERNALGSEPERGRPLAMERARFTAFDEQGRPERTTSRNSHEEGGLRTRPQAAPWRTGVLPEGAHRATATTGATARAQRPRRAAGRRPRSTPKRESSVW